MPLPDTVHRRAARWGGWLLLAGAAFGLLWRLDDLTLRQWDEARLASNALEMARSGRWLVTTYEDAPDLWNTKPPLMIWLQAGLIKLLGPTEWAVRLPAALAAWATIAVLYVFCARILRRPGAGAAAGAVLLGSAGFLGEHYGRTGDYDALLGLLQLGFSLGVWQWLETGQRRWWWVVGIGVALAILTKGVAALLCAPGIALYCLAEGRWRRIMTAPGFWLAALGALGVGAAWYALREAAAPGYWAAVQINELGGRFGQAIEEHAGPPTFYLYWLWEDKMSRVWVLLLPVLTLVALRQPETRVRRFSWYAACWALSYLAIVSAAATKLTWYMVPAFPWLALLAGLGLTHAGTWLSSQWRSATDRLLLQVGMAALLLTPAILTIRHELRGVRRDRQDNRAEYLSSYGVRAVARRAQPPTPLTAIVPGGYNAAQRFYLLPYPTGDARRAGANEIPVLTSDTWVVTGTAADSAAFRQAYPAASVEVASERPRTWLWHR